MSLSTNIVRRGAHYYVRVRVPTDLLATFKREEIWRSLGTTDTKKARRLGTQIIADMHKKWADMRLEEAAKPARLKRWENDEDAKPLIRAYTEQLYDHLDDQAANLAKPPRLSTLSDTDLRRYAREYYDWEMARDDDARSPDSLGQAVALSDHAHLIDLNIRETIDCLNSHSFHLVAHYADHICARDGIPKFATPVWEHEAGKPHQTYRRLGHVLLRAHLEALKRQRERQDGRFDGVPTDRLIADLQPPLPASPLSCAPVAMVARSEALRVRVEQYLTERGNTISAEWVHALRAAVELFIEYGGESTLANAVTKKLANGWKEALHRYPSRGKIRYPKLNFKEILERNATDKNPVLAARTINKYITAMSTLYDWIVRHEHDGVERNPFDGLLITGADKGEQRDPLSMSQLHVLFTSPLFVGCKSGSDADAAKPGDHQIRDWRYWMPLIALFTGSRLGEPAQLCLDDIKTQGAVNFISFNTIGGKTLKNRNAARLVPIHSTLIELGFLDHVKALRASGETRLFPEIKPDALGRYSSNPSRFFARYLKKIGVKTDSRLCMHSFRHTFIDALREAGYDDRSLAPLIGHGTSGAPVTAGYGAGPSFPMASREAMINAIQYDLDLSHLMPLKGAGVATSAS